MPLNKVQAGQKLQVAADTWNAMLEAAQDYQVRLNSQGGPLSPDNREFGLVLVKNTSEDGCLQFDVLGLDAKTIVIDPDDNEQEFRQRIVLTGVTPKDEHKDCFCILAEPIPAGRLGRAMLVGVTPCRVDIQNESDTHAEPKADTTENLVSTSSGIARILWKQSGTGVKLAIVRLGGGGSPGEWTGRVASNDTAKQTASVRKVDGDPTGTFSDTEPPKDQQDGKYWETGDPVVDIWCPARMNLQGFIVKVRPTGMAARPWMVDWFSPQRWMGPS